MQFEEWEPPLAVTLGIAAAWFLPGMYLTAFTLWHWKYRYRGTRPVAWVVSFPLLWFVWPAAIYYGCYVEPDRKGKKQYADDVQPQANLPKRYNMLRSVFFVIGGVLVGWGVYSVTLTAVTIAVIFNPFMRAIQRRVDTTLTHAEVEALHVMFTVCQLLAWLVFAIAMCCAIGSVLLVMSGNIRWRLKEQQELDGSVG